METAKIRESNNELDSSPHKSYVLAIYLFRPKYLKLSIKLYFLAFSIYDLAVKLVKVN